MPIRMGAPTYRDRATALGCAEARSNAHLPQAGVPGAHNPGPRNRARETITRSPAATSPRPRLDSRHPFRQRRNRLKSPEELRSASERSRSAIPCRQSAANANAASRLDDLSPVSCPDTASTSSGAAARNVPQKEFCSRQRMLQSAHSHWSRRCAGRAQQSHIVRQRIEVGACTAAPKAQGRAFLIEH